LPGRTGCRRAAGRLRRTPPGRAVRRPADLVRAGHRGVLGGRPRDLARGAGHPRLPPARAGAGDLQGPRRIVVLPRGCGDRGGRGAAAESSARQRGGIPGEPGIA